MESVTLDSELAQEMVKLLGNELKVVRQQLRECQGQTFQDENTLLRNELEDMQFRLATALEGQDRKPNPEALDNSNNQVSYIISENDRKEQEAAETIARLQEKLELSREKCKKYKGIKEQLQETLHDVQSQLSEAVAQRDTALEHALVAEERTAVAVARAEATTPFNAVEFLASPSAETPQPPVPSIKPYSTRLDFVIPKTVRDLGAADGCCSYSKHEVIWPDSMITHCLVFAPMHWYNGKGKEGTGAWEKTHSHQGRKLRPAQTRDLFYLDDRAWYYYGTFECVGVTAMSSEQVQNLRAGLMDYVERRTVLFPDLVPPFVTKMVHNMYAEGILKVECLAMRCVGFNHELDQALRSPLGPKAGLSIVSEPKEGSTKKDQPKRARDSDGAARSHKRQKKSA